MKSTTNERYENVGYNSVAIFIRLAPQNSTKIRTYSIWRSSKVIDLGVNRKRMQLPITH